MDKVLLVSVIALAVALLSMLVNLALVWKISDLKSRIDYVELTLQYRTSQLHKDDVEISNQLNKLECDTKDAFEIVTNNLKLHGTLLDEMSTKFALLDGRVSEHHKRLEDLGNFAGITTGELRVLEQKIYNSCKPKELPDPEPMVGGKDVLPNEMKETLEKDIRKHKPDRRRKDNYYRKPNKSNVVIDEFASDIIE